MLEFNIEPLSGQLVAHSEKCKFTSYWISERAWAYLTIVDPGVNGPGISPGGAYLSIDETKQAAEDHELRIGLKDSETE